MSSRVTELAGRWNLELEPLDRSYGDWNEIIFAHRHGVPCVLKITGAGHSGDDEAEALTAWDGDGAVRLLDRAPGALLLERLDPDTSLTAVPFLQACEIFATLLQRLTVPAPTGLPLLTDSARAVVNLRTSSTGLSDGLSTGLLDGELDAVRRLAAELAEDPGEILVHGDLHSGNILAGRREQWLAIDPKPTTGHPERSLAEFLWTRVDEIDDIAGALTRLVDSAGLDLERARRWTVVRSTGYLAWAVANGLTEDPARCRRLIRALL